jgi:hypothetical protein
MARLEAGRGPLSNACPSPGPSVISVVGGLGSAAPPTPAADIAADVSPSCMMAPANCLRVGTDAAIAELNASATSPTCRRGTAPRRWPGRSR